MALAPLAWSRRDLSYRDWMKELWFTTVYEPAPSFCASAEIDSSEWLMIGEGAVRVVPKAVCVGVEQLADSSLVQQLLARSWKCIIFAETLVAEDPTLTGPTLAALLRLAQGLASQRVPAKLILLSAGAQSASGAIGRGLLGAASWGFLRSLRLEVPSLQLRLVDITGRRRRRSFRSGVRAGSIRLGVRGGLCNLGDRLRARRGATNTKT